MTKSTTGSRNKRRHGYRKPANNFQSSAKSRQSSRQGTHHGAGQVEGATNRPEFIEVDIDNLSYDAKGIARLHGRACFIPEALPGERIKAQITAANNKRVEARLIKVIDASQNRVIPKCSVYGECGGCDLQHLNHEAQIQHKQSIVEQLILRGTDLDHVTWNAPILSDHGGFAYRRKIRLACYYDPSSETLNVGFRASKSKKIVPVKGCVIVTKELGRLLDAVYQLLDQLHQSVSKTSVLRHFAHIECVADEDSQSVCFRLMDDLPESLEANIKQWASDYDLNLWLRTADQPVRFLQGNEAVTCFKNGLKLAYSPEDFLQVNGKVNERLVERVMEALSITGSDKVLDLFSGLGNFSLSCARTAHHVKAIEAIESMVEKAVSNARLNGLDNFTVEVQDLFDERSLEWLDESFDCVILDPPRAGAELISRHVGRTHASRIAYVSCNPQSLARDSRAILEQGYHLEGLTLLDMFPQTSHIETLAIFKK